MLPERNVSTKKGTGDQYSIIDAVEITAARATLRAGCSTASTIVVALQKFTVSNADGLCGRDSGERVIQGTAHPKAFFADNVEAHGLIRDTVSACFVRERYVGRPVIDKSIRKERRNVNEATKKCFDKGLIFFSVEDLPKERSFGEKTEKERFITGTILGKGISKGYFIDLTIPIRIRDIKEPIQELGDDTTLSEQGSAVKDSVGAILTLAVVERRRRRRVRRSFVGFTFSKNPKARKLKITKDTLTFVAVKDTQQRTRALVPKRATGLSLANAWTALFLVGASRDSHVKAR